MASNRITPTRRRVTAAMGSLPVMALAAAPATVQAGNDAGILAAWEVRQRALAEIEARGEAQPLLDKAGVKPDPGILALTTKGNAFVNAAQGGRIWGREPLVRTPF